MPLNLTSQKPLTSSFVFVAMMMMVVVVGMCRNKSYPPKNSHTPKSQKTPFDAGKRSYLSSQN